MKESIAVLDYSVSEVHIYEVPNEDIDIEEFLKNRGHKMSECSYMISENLKIRVE